MISLDLRHELGRPCPVTGKKIPGQNRYITEFTWTDHEREGNYNSCLACNPKAPRSLQEINNDRKAIAEDLFGKEVK